MYDQFAKTIQDSSNVTAPASPLGNFPELQNYFKGAFQGAQAGAAGGALINNAAQQEQERRQAEAAARQQEVQALKQSIADTTAAHDPKNYQQVQKQDGGYDYLDGAGKPISLAQYSRDTGVDPTKALAGSTNAKDIQYLNDYGNLQKVVNAALNNDTDTLKKLAVGLYGDNTKPADDPANKGIVDNFLNNLKKQKPQDLIQNFTKYYSNVYSDHPWNQLPQGSSQTHGQTDTPYLGL